MSLYALLLFGLLRAVTLQVRGLEDHTVMKATLLSSPATSNLAQPSRHFLPLTDLPPTWQAAKTLPFALAAMNLSGTVARNADGSCPTFPPNNPWNLDVSRLPVSPLGWDGVCKSCLSWEGLQTSYFAEVSRHTSDCTCYTIFRSTRTAPPSRR